MKQNKTLQGLSGQDYHALFMRSLPNLLVSVTIIVLILLFRPTIQILIGSFTLITIVRSVYNTIRHKKKFSIIALIKSLIFLYAFILVFYLTQRYLGYKGVLILLILFAGYQIYRNRDIFMTGVRDIETKLFGKPLDRELWEKGELRQRKMKFVWMKKDVEEND